MASDKENVREFVAALKKQIEATEGFFDPGYRPAIVRHIYSKWLGEGRSDAAAEKVADDLTKAFALEDGTISLDWYREQSDGRMRELVASQEELCDEIDEAKRSLEAAAERKKSAQASIEEGHSRLRNLARSLRQPYVFVLPPPPNRQRELPLADGEEWRATLLADVLASDVVLKGIALEKLGNVNLGQYTELVQKFGMGDKPKKLTRKQWDRVEEVVQAWHEEHGAADSEEDDEEVDN